MKRLLFLILLFGTTQLLLAQDTATVNGYIRDNIRDKRPDKVTAEQLQQALLKVSNFAGSNTIQNQNAAKQSAKTWIDSSRATKAQIDSALNIQNPLTGKSFLDYSNGYMKLNMTHANKDLNNPATGYGNIGAVFQSSARYDSSKNAYRTEALNWFDNTNYIDTGNTYWGRNAFVFSQPLQARLNFRLQANNNDAQYRLVTDMWTTMTAHKGVVSGGLWSARGPGDSIKFYTGNGWNAPTNYFAYTDLNNGGNYQQSSGQWINFTSYWQLPGHAGGQLNEFIDFYAGGYHGGKAGLLRKSFAFFADDSRMDNPQDPWGVFIKGGRRNYFDKSLQIGDSSKLNLDVHRFYVSGSSKFSGNIVQNTGRTLLAGAVDDNATALQVGGAGKVKDYFVIDHKDNAGVNGTLLKMGGRHTSTYFGWNSLNNNNDAALTNNWFQNTAFGFAALQNDNGGGNNNAFGGWALGGLTTGDNNCAFGRDAMGSVTTGAQNAGFGTAAMYYLTTGQYNTSIGSRTGYGITTGNYNTILGAQVQSLPATLEKTVIIATGEGGTSAYRIYSPSSGNVLFGTTTDDTLNKVQVSGTVKATSFISTSITAPTSSADATGQTGEIRIVSGYLYAKDAAGWKRTALTTF